MIVGQVFTFKHEEMETMFKKILVPWDGSKLAATIIPKVEEMAKCFGAEVTLIMVGNIATVATAAEFSFKAVDDISAQMKEASVRALSEMTAAMSQKGVNADYVYLEGTAAHEIISYAADNGYDLIAMATHGKGEVAWVLGSVAEKVVSHATVPVLLVRVIEMKAPASKEVYAVGPD